MKKYLIKVNGNQYEVEVEEVKVESAAATSAPVKAAPAAPASLCISVTCGTVPHIFFLALADHSSECSPIGDEGVIG